MNEHMDELFRRAAENYPLKTESGDWSKVLNSLSDDKDSEPIKTVGAAKRNPLKGLLLLILFMFPFIYLKDSYWKFEGKGGKGYTETLANNRPYNQDDQPLTADTTAPSENTTDDKFQTEKLTDQHKTIDTNPISNNNGNVFKPAKPAVDIASSTVSTKKANGTNGKLKIAGAQHSADEIDVDQITNGGGYALLKKKRPNKFSVDIKNGGIKRNTVIEPENEDEEQTSQTGSTEKINVGSDSKLNPNKIIEGAADSVPKVMAEKKDITPAKKDSIKENVAKKDKTKLSKNRFLYVGIMAGPDVSMIKFQTIKSAGVSMGAMVGYQFNKKWAIESGAFWDQKYYYTKGEYFDPKHLYLPASAKLNFVNGSCNMWEIPLVVRYNFKPKKSLTWFATAGASSYIIKKESYDYNVTNNMQTYFRYRKYTTTYKNWFGAAAVSFGFNHALRKSTNFRVESYFKVPLKGMGTGNLDVLSTGINLGVTQKLF